MYNNRGKIPSILSKYPKFPKQVPMSTYSPFLNVP